jgi:hypothetical protein
MKIAVVWVVALCSLVEVYRRFRGACCVHHQGDRSHVARMINAHLRTVVKERTELCCDAFSSDQPCQCEPGVDDGSRDSPRYIPYWHDWSADTYLQSLTVKASNLIRFPSPYSILLRIHFCAVYTMTLKEYFKSFSFNFSPNVRKASPFLLVCAPRMRRTCDNTDGHSCLALIWKVWSLTGSCVAGQCVSPGCANGSIVRGMRRNRDGWKRPCIQLFTLTGKDEVWVLASSVMASSQVEIGEKGSGTHRYYRPTGIELGHPTQDNSYGRTQTA